MGDEPKSLVDAVDAVVNEVVAPAKAAPKRFCKDCRWIQGIPPDLPMSPFCMRPEAVYVEEDVVTGRTKTKRVPAHNFRVATLTPGGNVLACGPDARYFEPREAK